jgi:hypothetical protein
MLESSPGGLLARGKFKRPIADIQNLAGIAPPKLIISLIPKPF